MFRGLNKFIGGIPSRWVTTLPCLVANGNTAMDVTSKFIKGKMQMFAKVSLKSFVYDMIDVFCFPTEEVKMIYDKYGIIKCHLYLNLTDANSCSRFFNFICKKECNIKESKSRNVIFQILKQSKIAERLDVSDTFWSQFEIRDENVKKQVGLYEVEYINNANICTIVINPKEYFEKLENWTLNKKHKGVRQDAKGVNFENYE